MDVSDSPQSYTVLRIKRKRNEEPLDALVVEAGARRKKSRGGVNVFQYAQTVERNAWEDDLQRQAIQNEITRLAKTAPAMPQPTPRPTSIEQRSRRYTVVMQPSEEAERRSKPLLPKSPPKVVPVASLPSQNFKPEPTTKDWKLYDAVLQSESLASIPSIEEDEEMAKFIPMLNDYLKLHEIDVSNNTPIPASDSAESTEEDYVYDVFFRPSASTGIGKPLSSSEWNAIAVGNNFATLVGYTSSDDEEEEEEVEDEADEDSNDEGFYRNDYPEGDDSDDDNASYRDSADDFDSYNDDSDHEWR